VVFVGQDENADTLHPMELLNHSESADDQNCVGNFKARMRQKARYVDDEEWTGCGLLPGGPPDQRHPPVEADREGGMGIAERRPG
jgi:heterodisulfide reductase subunit A-like polyferredoxin